MLLAAAVGLILLMFGAGAQRAEAACSSNHAPEYGTWVAADPNTKGLTRIQLEDCASVTTCSGETCSVAHDAGWAMRVWGKCTPTDCDWGWSAGAFRVSGRVFGYFDQGFAKKRIYAKMSQYRPGQLWVYRTTDYVDPNRADTTLQEWFVRA